MGIPVTVMAGDGIGPEVVGCARRVLDASGVPIVWHERLISEAAYDRYKRYLPDSTLTSIRRTKVALKGPTGTPQGGKGGRRRRKSLNVRLRTKFDLMANYRPAVSVPGVETVYSGMKVDLIVIRENTEGEYLVREKRIKGGVETTFVFTDPGSERIARYAFEKARALGRRKVTAVAKDNIWQEGHGLFIRAAEKVASEYKDIGFNTLIADNCFQQLALDPTQFDVILTTNLLGDLLSDLCAGIVGGLGYAPGANIGRDVAIFEPVHGTAPDIVGKGLANPAPTILSGALMFDHLGYTEAAARIRSAVYGVVATRPDLVLPKGRVKSSQLFTDAVIERLG
jgi:isocitrate dehydrogenase (NAD+)